MEGTAASGNGQSLGGFPKSRAGVGIFEQVIYGGRGLRRTCEGGRMGCREKLSWDAVAEGALVIPEGDGKWTWPFGGPHRGEGARPFVSLQKPTSRCHWKLAVTLTEALPFGRGPF